MSLLFDVILFFCYFSVVVVDAWIDGCKCDLFGWCAIHIIFQFRFLCLHFYTFASFRWIFLPATRHLGENANVNCEYRHLQEFTQQRITWIMFQYFFISSLNTFSKMVKCLVMHTFHGRSNWKFRLLKMIPEIMELNWIWFGEAGEK